MPANVRTLWRSEKAPQTGNDIVDVWCHGRGIRMNEGHFQFLQDGLAEKRSRAKSAMTGGLPRVIGYFSDNQSTVDVFCNRESALQRPSAEGSMKIHCNAGVATTDQVGDLDGYGTVWYHPNGIANILSLSRVREHGYRVTYDSDNGNRFTVHKSDGTAVQESFEQSESGLILHGHETQRTAATVMVNTVAGNRNSYTNRAYSRALTGSSSPANDRSPQYATVHKNRGKQSLA
jgi:hypothetical protein